MIDIILVFDSRFKQIIFESLLEKKLGHINFMIYIGTNRNCIQTLELSTPTGGLYS